MTTPDSASVTAIHIHPIIHPPFGATTYVVHTQGHPEAVLIDCGRDVDAIYTHLQQHQLTYTDVLHTHAFIECLEGQPKLRENDDLIAHMSPMDEFWLAHLDTQAIVLNVDTVPMAFVDQQVLHDDVLTCAGMEVRVMETPGITPGSITYYFPQANAAFVGDIVRNGKLGPTDLPHSSEKLLSQAIELRLGTLPDETLLYPSRGPAITVAELKSLLVSA